ncbi:thiopurine S-methyltransferase (TPMT) [Rubidibacter lacunae KORDI 51-2]|uniref:Thiopurine S-methyltransferase (TPMT) n=1 Tax=Rubidibacter lacunae KORDI 51-2 TaxID=582515 RepID=U5D7E8_9CHRO|nr:methyltransferase domain-containing protein [Rubidibacter lacunae]ERN40553.1 thiopurine S-methyltransferase (TPMT) [Rubidibacter lacunae KORDI 51-2]
MTDVARSEYWESRYLDGSTRWDLGQPAPPFASWLASEMALPLGRAIVLGCGRGSDALLFARHGFEVVGVDFAPSAIASATAAAARDGIPATFLLSDIFALPQEFAGSFDYAIEHTCFCALPPTQRDAYVQLTRSLLKPGGELLAIFFTHSRPGGPPFGSHPADIVRLFGRAFEILCLEPIAHSISVRQGEEHFGRLRRRDEQYTDRERSLL